MTVEEQVTSLEISQRLKDLGVKQEGIFKWFRTSGRDEQDKKPVTFVSDELTQDIQRMYMRAEFPMARESDEKVICSAFTVAELGGLLPKVIDHKDSRYNLRMWGGSTGNTDFYSVQYESWGGSQLCCKSEGTEADARGKMLIYLIENKLI